MPGLTSTTLLARYCRNGHALFFVEIAQPESEERGVVGFEHFGRTTLHRITQEGIECARANGHDISALMALVGQTPFSSRGSVTSVTQAVRRDTLRPRRAAALPSP